jgi:hypothetical protein
VDYLEMDVTTPAPLTMSDPAHGCSQVARGHAKAAILAALPEAAE